MDQESTRGLRRWWEALILGALALLALVVLFQAQQPGVFGLYNDDGDYLKGAKAIALGKGYIDLGALGAQQLPRYPIGFSAMLAPLAWAFPDLWAFVFSAKCLVGLLSIGFVLLGYRYLRSWCGASPWVAGAAMGLLALNTAFIEFGSSVMSDLPYGLFALLTLFACERVLAAEGRALRSELLTAILLVATCLIRYAGVSLILAMAIAFLQRRKPWVLFRIYLMAGLLWQPWLWYHLSSGSTASYGSEFIGAQSQSLAGSHFLFNVSASVYHLCLEALPALLLPLQAIKTVLPSVPPLVWLVVGGLTAGGVLLTLRAWLLEAWRERDRSVLAPAYAVSTLLVVTVWNTAYTGLGVWQHVRLLLPILPFLLFLGLRDLDQLAGARRWSMAGATAVLVVTMAFQATWLIEFRQGPNLTPWDGYLQMVATVDRLTPKSAMVLSWNPPIYTLATNRAAIQFPETPKELVERLMTFPITFIVSSPNFELDGTDRNETMVGGLREALPGVLHLVCRNEISRQSLWQVNRKKLMESVLAIKRLRRNHSPGSRTDN